ncbi:MULTISPECIES: LptA/OstA family protein [unclassified Azospirillum]|uniref:LptA/OstA family protein n=1 Tax=unclassified Azospirillum TaxID=2630922 RepID=UPI000B6DDB65|nr:MULTISPECIES: LptA/OstA family protein [unclassified Azospirillum]SNR94719.1 lipopolysaccharide export system protein LptA [Azospirillum sp. RU38E]SNS10871.1 lipopolysaccharide export system protein LptA [Azospirillum sp. RU37A]
MSMMNEHFRRWRRPLAITAIGLALVIGRPVPAQSPSLEMGGEKPIDVVAPGGFEFHEKENVAIARGGATATQGDMTLKAQTLAAYFRKNAQGTNEIYRLLAEGNVELHGQSQSAYGTRGIYDLDRSVAVLTGEGLRLVTEQDTVTATDSLEYWRTENLTVARGNAVAIRENNRVRADRLVGLLTTDKQDKQSLSRVDATGNVVITTPQEVARGDKGTYDLDTEMALLTGNVKVTRGQNQLNGPAAQVDLKSGVSRMLSQVPGGSPVQGGTQQPTGDGRVRGLFIPDSQGRGGQPQQPATPPPSGQQTQPGQGSKKP